MYPVNLIFRNGDKDASRKDAKYAKYGENKKKILTADLHRLAQIVFRPEWPKHALTGMKTSICVNRRESAVSS